jgi:hypothetical protein
MGSITLERPQSQNVGRSSQGEVLPNREAGLGEFHRSSSMPPVAEEREGLPSHYRMRADAHYVDQLDAPPASAIQMVAVDAIDLPGEAAPPAPALLDSITRHGVLEPLLVQRRDRRYTLLAGRRRLAAATTLGLREVPCFVRRLTDDEARSLAAVLQVPVDNPQPDTRQSDVFDEDQVAASLLAVLSCTDLMGEGTPRLTRDVAVDMIRAETRRAICALRTAQLLTRGVPHASSAVTVGRILAGVVECVSPEVRLRGSRLTTRVDVSDDTMLDVDEPSLIAALSAVVLLLSAGLRDVRGARLDLHVSTPQPGRIMLTITQESVILPNATLAITNDDAPALVPAVAPLVALRQLARHHGGTCTVSRLARGTQVSLTLPQSEDGERSVRAAGRD